MTHRRPSVSVDDAARAGALRQSMLTLMNDRDAPYFAHPAAWAPFVLVGETR